MIKWIPVDLCIYVLRENKVGMFRTFLHLKQIAQNGYVEISSILISELAEVSNKSTRTIKNHLENMDSLRWINTINRTVYIRKMARVDRIIDGKYYRKAEFSENYLKDLREYLFAVFVARLIINQKYKRVRKSEKISQNTYKGNCSYHGKINPGFLPIANSAISKLLGVSCSTAQRYKNNALQKGFIEIVPSRIISNYTKEQINFARDHNFFSQEKYRMVSGRLVEIGADLLKSNILLKRFKC